MGHDQKRSGIRHADIVDAARPADKSKISKG